MSTRRILACSSIRSDYDLLSKLYRELNKDTFFEFGIIISGAHLSQTYGESVKEIEADNIPIVAKIDCLLESDRRGSRLRSASILMLEAITAIESWRPDILIFAGDREDALVFATIGAYLNIPTVHFYGGDHTTDGNVDNPVRHATSKLSTFHFVAHEAHARRLLKFGEPSSHIFNAGSPALDKFNDEPRLDMELLVKDMGVNEWKEYCLVIFHPILGSELDAGIQFKNLLLELKQRKIHAFVSHPNIDAGNKEILKVIHEFANDPQFKFIKNISRRHFVNLMRNARFTIGNSSAGILEAPIIPLGVVNVGERQRGRLDCGNVVFVDNDRESISKGIDKVISAEFQNRLKTTVSAYGNGRSVARIVEKLKELDLSKSNTLKIFDPLQGEGAQ